MVGMKQCEFWKSAAFFWGSMHLPWVRGEKGRGGRGFYFRLGSGASLAVLGAGGRPKATLEDGPRRHVLGCVLRWSIPPKTVSNTQ